MRNTTYVSVILSKLWWISVLAAYIAGATSSLCSSGAAGAENGTSSNIAFTGAGTTSAVGDGEHTMSGTAKAGVWEVVPSPNFRYTGTAYPDTSNYLTKVTCTSKFDCWAVGYRLNRTDVPTYSTLILRWSGSGWHDAKWRIVESPTVDGNSRLMDVTCVSPSDCWAVGYSGDRVAQGSHTLVLHWDGNSWSTVPSPSVNSPWTNWLDAVACTSSSECWSVGGYASAANDFGPGLVCLSLLLSLFIVSRADASR